MCFLFLQVVTLLPDCVSFGQKMYHHLEMPRLNVSNSNLFGAQEKAAWA